MATELDQSDRPDDPISYYLDDQRFHGKSQRTLTAYERVLREFESHVFDSPGDIDSHSFQRQVGRRDCMEWVHSLREDHKPSTVASYASYVHRFFDYMNEIGTFESNPMTLVMAEMPESIETDPTRRDLSVDQMREFLASMGHPLDRVLVMTFLKTGIRVGELCNLDVRDLNVSVDGLEFDFDCRVELEGREDSLFIPEEPAYGRSYNGEERSASNKRKRSTIVPIDGELRVALISWLAIRPETTSPAEPLFVDTGDRWGRRLRPSEVRYRVTKHARAHGWYSTGGGSAENVTPHYFRHFFTTHLRDRTGDRGIVKYLRGDVATDIIDTYTHNWGDRVRSVYLRHIYSLS